MTCSICRYCSTENLSFNRESIKSFNNIFFNNVANLPVLPLSELKTSRSSTMVPMELNLLKIWLVVVVVLDIVALCLLFGCCNCRFGLDGSRLRPKIYTRNIKNRREMLKNKIKSCFKSNRKGKEKKPPREDESTGEESMKFSHKMQISLILVCRCRFQSPNTKMHRSPKIRQWQFRPEPAQLPTNQSASLCLVYKDNGRSFAN